MIEMKVIEMKVIKTKDGSLTMHTTGEDNEYQVSMNENKSNGKVDTRINNFNAYDFVSGIKSRLRSIEEVKISIKQFNDLLKLEKKSKSLEELGLQVKMLVLDDLKMPEFETVVDKSIFNISNKLKELETQKGNGVLTVMAKNPEGPDMPIKITDGIKQLITQLETQKRFKRFYKTPSNIETLCEYFNLYLRNKFKLDKKSLTDARFDKMVELKEYSEMFNESRKCFNLAKVWLMVNEPKKFKTLFPEEVKEK